jgi:hypothetical protein
MLSDAIRAASRTTSLSARPRTVTTLVNALALPLAKSFEHPLRLSDHFVVEAPAAGEEL